MPANSRWDYNSEFKGLKSLSFMAVYIPSFQVLRGRPRFFLPSGFQWIAIFGSRGWSILSTLLYQKSCFRVMSSNIISCASIFPLRRWYMPIPTAVIVEQEGSEFLRTTVTHLSYRTWFYYQWPQNNMYQNYVNLTKWHLFLPYNTSFEKGGRGQILGTTLTNQNSIQE